MPCLFCDLPFDKAAKREESEEHIFPLWSRPYLQSEQGPGSHWHWKAQGEKREERTYPAVPAQQTVRGVCARCNTGWMSDIETAVKPYLLPAMQGKGRRYNDDAQLRLATWALKTALVIGAKGGYVPVPRSFLHDFERKRRPDSKTRIWVGATPYGPTSPYGQMTYVDRRSLLVPSEGEEPPPTTNGYATVLSIGHVAFYVVAWSVSKPPMEFLYRHFSRSMLPLWPSRGPLEWPPDEILTRTGLDSLADGFGPR